MADFEPGLDTIRNVQDLRTEMCSQEEADHAYLALHAATTSEELREVFEEQACILLRSEHSQFWLLEKKGRMKSLVRPKEDGKSHVSCPVGEGIAGQVAKGNGYYVCNTPDTDSMFNKTIDGVPTRKTRNLVSVAVSHGDELAGVIQVANRTTGSYSENDAYWLQGLAEHAALATQRLRRLEDGWALVRNLAETLADAVDDKHVSTVGHSDRTRQIALALGREMRLTDDELTELELAALLHDVGRLALAPEAFEWAGGPGGAASGYASPGEKMHLILTEAVLRKLKLPTYLARMSEIALSHHEKADGSGYPKGRNSAQLSLASRILAVANAYDMLTSGRAVEAQGKPLNRQDALRIIKLRATTEFDPAVVDRMIKNKLYEIEKRRYPRYDYEAPLEVIVIRESGESDQEKAVETEALNLSEGGILFRSETELPGHALLRMKIHLPTESLTALARVARNLPGKDGKGYQVGAYFLWYGSQQEEAEEDAVLAEEDVEQDEADEEEEELQEEDEDSEDDEDDEDDEDSEDKE